MRLRFFVSDSFPLFSPRVLQKTLRVMYNVKYTEKKEASYVLFS